MLDAIRDAPIGQIIRLITKNKVLLYPEEKPDFQVPAYYTKEGFELAKLEDTVHDKPIADQPSTPSNPTNATSSSSSSVDELEKAPLDRVPTAQEGAQYEAINATRSRRSQHSHMSRSASRSANRADLELALSNATAEKGPSRPIVPTRTHDGIVLVDWYADDDPENPQNWVFRKKMYATAIICIYTLAVYMGSSIYAPAVGYIIEDFGVSQQVASLGLSLYVLAYGLGPMLFSPLSEIPAVGRNWPYVITFFLFVMFTWPAGLAKNFPSLAVFRFLQGFFGSPCLATGGASLQDMFDLIHMPYLIAVWAATATLGPSLGPMISGFSVGPKGWQWSMWEIMFLAGPTFLVMLCFLPETNGDTVLYHRAHRLRRITGNDKLKAQSELDQAGMSVTGLVWENLYRPIQMMALDPAVLFTAIYTALIYGIYYSFFESFPLVYVDLYHFSLGEQGLAFLSLAIGTLLALFIYLGYINRVVVPHMKLHGFGAPERRLIPALISTFLLPVGLFLFGWTARASVPWIVPTLGIGIFTLGVFIVIQCIFVFLPLTYPKYAASLFAGNDLVRSSLACGAIHFSPPLFRNLGIGRGISILGGLTGGCIIGLYALWYFGASLRARSRFATK